jgi:hypothetical protein
VKPTKDGKKKRPVGTKVAKQAKADGEIVKKLFDNSIDSSQSEKKKWKKQEDFYTKMGGAVDMAAQMMAINMQNAQSQEMTKLLGFCSPTTRKTLAAKLMKEKLRDMNRRGNKNITNQQRRSITTVASAVTCDVHSSSSDDESSSSSSSSDIEELELQDKTSRALLAAGVNPTEVADDDDSDDCSNNNN